MTRDPDNYFKNKQVINFDIVNHQCCSDQLKKLEKEHKTIENNNFNNYPKNEKKYCLQCLGIKGMICG